MSLDGTNPPSGKDIPMFHLRSSTLPIALHVLNAPDARMFAHLLSDPANGHSGPDFDTPWAEGAISRQRAAAAVPTLTDASGGTVLSGPKSCNLGIYHVDPSSGSETMIGLGGYGAIKELKREGGKIRAGDVGVLLDTRHRGRGYAVEAMKLSLDFGAAPVSEGGLQLDAISITTLESNTAMRRLAEDRLACKGGILRPAEFEKGEQEVYWEITAAEWRRKRAQGRHRSYCILLL